MGRRAGPGLLADWAAGSWVVGAEVRVLQCWSAGSGRGTPLQEEQERRGGRRGLRSWPLRCLSQFLSERKERLLRLLGMGVSMCCVPFTDGVTLYL